MYDRDKLAECLANRIELNSISQKILENPEFKKDIEQRLDSIIQDSYESLQKIKAKTNEQLTPKELIERSAVECYKMITKVKEFDYYLDWGPTVIDNHKLKLALEAFVWELNQELRHLEEDEKALEEEGGPNV